MPNSLYGFTATNIVPVYVCWKNNVKESFLKIQTTVLIICTFK